MEVPSIQGFLDKAAVIGFEEHLRPTVTQTFKDLLAGTLKVVANLLPAERQAVVEIMPCPVVFAVPVKPTIQPHPVLAAVRGSVRQVVESDLSRHSKVTTMFCGATAREITNGLTNQYWYHSVYNSETKDTQRTMTPLLNAISDNFTKVCKYYKMDDHDLDLDDESVVNAYAAMQGAEGKVGFRMEYSGACKVERLVWLDSAYNMTWQSFESAFRSTGASCAKLLMFMPPELVSMECPEDPHYKLERYFAGGVERARLVDKFGFANGYDHVLSEWSTLLREPAYQGKEFNLVSEIESRVGPYMVINISKTTKGGIITRDLTLFRQRYVKVLDVRSLIKSKRSWGEDFVASVEPSDYFLVPRSEYQQVYTYVASLDRKTPDLEVITSFVRKRSGGAALIDKSLSKPWQSEQEFHSALCAAVLVKVRLDQAEFDEGMGRAVEMDASALLRKIQSVVSLVLAPISVIVDFFRKVGAVDFLVVDHFPVLKQTVVLPDRGFKTTHKLSFRNPNKLMEMPETGETCDMCKEFPEMRLGDNRSLQHWTCPGQKFAEVEHTFHLTTEDLERFRLEQLSPKDDDPEGIVRVKKAAKDKCPRSGFTFTTRVRTVQGAFGTGKSHFVKSIVNMDDAVLAPFSELRKDYDKDAQGNDIFFKTNHRAISDMEAKKRFFVDEFGSMTYEFLAVAAYLGQPELVYLIGDLKQTKVLASEGILISNRVPCKKAHVLIKNFRNTTGTIEWANERFGYTLEAAGPSFNSDGPCYVFEEDCGLTPDELEQCYRVSPDRLLVDLEESDNTARAMQGKTLDRMRLVLSPTSMNTFRVGCVRLVAVTRTRSPVIISCTPDLDRQEVIALMNRVEHQPVKDRSATVHDRVEFTVATRLYKVLVALAESNETRVAAVRTFNRAVLAAEFKDDLDALRRWQLSLSDDTDLAELHATQFEPGYRDPVVERGPVEVPKAVRPPLPPHDPLRGALVLSRFEEPIIPPDHTVDLQDWCETFLENEAYAGLVEDARIAALRGLGKGVREARSAALEVDLLRYPSYFGSVENRVALDASVAFVNGVSRPAKRSRFTPRQNLPVHRVPVSDSTGVVDSGVDTWTSVKGKHDDVKVAGDRSGFLETVRKFTPLFDLKKSSQAAPVLDLATSVYRSSKDSYLSAKDMDPHSWAGGAALNRITKMPGTVFTARITGDITTRVNARGNPKKMVRVFKMGTGNALSYDNGHPTQELHTAAARYAVPQKAYKLGEEGNRLAAEIARVGFDACIDRERLAAAWNDMDAANVLEGFMEKARRSGYASTWKEDADPQKPELRFHPKAQQKVKEAPITFAATFKAPQGISATSKEFNTLMGSAARFIASVINASLKDEFVWNNGKTTKEAAGRYTAAALKIPVDDNVTLDVVEMDKEQNAFTHMINRQFDTLIGVSQEFLDVYYGLYEHYKLIGMEFTASLRWVKPSGAPWTLKGNSFLEFLLANYMVIGDGPQAVFFQGDDLSRTQANMRVDVVRKSLVERYCAFQMSMVFSKEAAFCGFVYASGMLVPNIRRKLNKVIAAPIRSREHFYEYQAGIRDWLRDINAEDALPQVLQVNAQQLGADVSLVESWLDCIDSVAHASWDQWVSFAEKVDLNIDYLDSAGGLQSVW
uniref:Polyprotein n=1 Tax=Lentinula edodes ssRNA mycovirus TaxID=1068898 RepID=A0A0K2QPU6_9VIRU|nr:polyprotein [Lentinula edodes ssRNA mycovirus]